MFRSIIKAAAFCGLLITLATFTSSANAQSGSRLFGGGGSGSRLAAPTQQHQLSRSHQLRALLSRSHQLSHSHRLSHFLLVQVAAQFKLNRSLQLSHTLPTCSTNACTTRLLLQPMTVQSYAPQSYGSPVISSGCSSCGGGSSYAPAPVYSQPIYTPSNYNPWHCLPTIAVAVGCGCGR